MQNIPIFGGNAVHSVRFLFLPMVLSLLLSGCAQTRETSSTIFAMNTVMELTAYGDSGQQVLDQATERIYQLEHLLSVTDKNSYISAINHGEGAWVPVSQETFQLLSLALSYGRETQGALDITAYSAVHAWGFTTGEYRVPGPEELAELAARIDYTQVELDPEGCRVRLPQGMQLDLGSIAKGWASDLLAELAGGEPAIFNLGGNVRTAGDKPDGSPWRIGIQTPEAGSSGYLGVLELTGSQAVITSGGYERYFEEDGQTYWHIMDPETAAPARSGLKSVTIVSPLGVYCDALSTAVFVRGADWGADFWRTHQDFEMVLVLEDGSLWVTAGLAGSFTLAEDYQDLEVTVIQL